MNAELERYEEWMQQRTRDKEKETKQEIERTSDGDSTESVTSEKVNGDEEQEKNGESMTSTERKATINIEKDESE